MKNKKFLYKIIFIIIISLVLESCLKDNVSPVINFNFSNSALLLKYFEEQGDYINSYNMPSIVDVDEVQDNLGNYLILDIRTTSEYESGHIPGAIKVLPDSLIIYLNAISNINSYSKVVIVSASGQASSYFTSLIRLYGFNNIYSLNFGMVK